MKSSHPKISVVIPTFNSWTTLKACLASIYKQTPAPSEVIVVDNASADQTPTNVKKYFPKAKLIKLKRNTGVTGGRNTGIHAVSKESNYILFFDHDMVAAKNMLEKLVKTAQMDKSVGIITPKIYFWSDKDRVWAAGTNINLWTGQILFRGGKDKGQFEKIEEVQVAPAAMFVSAKVLRQVNEFDDRYFATYEDTDFCFRAKIKGFKTVYSPEALAFHKISPEVSDEQKRLLNRGFWIGRNRILFMGDYAKNFYLFLLISPIYLLYFAKLAFERRDFKGLALYFEGVVAGLTEELVARRMLIHLPFTMYNVLSNIIGDEPKSVLDVACGDGRSMGILNHSKRWKVTGVDIYEPYVNRAKQLRVYEDVIVGDVRKIDKIFKNKKFDVVLCSSVLDHLEKEDALNLIEKMEKLGKKVILSGLPNGFSEKHEPHFWEGDNEYQEHKSAWSINDFRQRNYTIRGFGSSALIGEDRITSNDFWTKNTFLMIANNFVTFIEHLLAYIASPIAYYFPNTSVCIMAIKNPRAKRNPD